MDKCRQDAPRDDGTLCDSGLGVSHADPEPGDATEAIGVSQANHSQQPTHLSETLMPEGEVPLTGAPAGEGTAVCPSALAQTLMPPTDPGATRQTPAEQRPTRLARPSTAPRDGLPSVAGYTVLGELGRGGMGVVYKARQPGLNRLVALKMIQSGKGTKRERDQFRLEAEVIARLQHPNIVQIYEIGEHNESLYFSLELVEGGSLADVLVRHRPTPVQSARIVRQLAEGMDLAHSQGIVHRDLKPANILMAGSTTAPLDERVPKITDFGLARQVEEGDRKNPLSGIMGTPSYMPPEQAEGRNHQVGPPADIYSLGAVLYDLLVGKPPFRGSTLQETLELVCKVRPRPPIEFNPAVPRDLQAICLKCLEKEPEKRYRSARELAGDLTAFLDGKPISARPCSGLERAWKWARRRPAAAGLLVVSVLALFGVAVGGVVLARQHAVLARDEAARRQEAEDRERVEKGLRREAERERERAEANFREARAAVDELRQIGHRRLSSVPHVEGVRRELLEKALAFNERFRAINGDLPAQRQEVGRAHLRVGEIQELLGRQKEAERAYRQALDSFTRLHEEAPESKEHRHDLAGTWNDLAILQAALSEHDQAEKSFAEAVALKAALAAEHDAAREARRDLARTYISRGHVRLARKKTAEAEADYREALTLLADLPREESLEDLARVHASLGALWTRSEPAKAAGFHQKAIEDWTALTSRTAEPRYRHELATALANRGALAHLQSRPKAAEADYREATRLLTTLTGEYRGVIAYRESLANVHHNHGQLLRDLGRHEDATGVWRAALSLWRRLAEDFPHRRDYRQKLGQDHNELAIALASTNRLSEVDGLWREAIAIQEQLVTEEPREEEYWQDLVNSSANRLTLLRALPATAELERAGRDFVRLHERRRTAFPKVPTYQKEWGQACYLLAGSLVKLGQSEAALIVLRETAAGGYRDQESLKSQPDWEPLRNRDAFKKLLN